MKVTARIPAPAKIASKPGVELVVVVDLVVLVGSVEGVVFVSVVVDLTASGPVVIVVDLVTSGPGVVLVVVVVDLVTSSAALTASSIIVAINIATNIFFISNLLFSCDRYESHLLPLSNIHNVFRVSNKCSPKLQAAIPPGEMCLQIGALVPPG
jgi:hypothetical protein